MDALSVCDNSDLPSDESGNLLNMILDSGAEEHSGFWTVRSLNRHDENSNGVRGSSLFALEKQQRHHGEWRVSTLENHESNGRGVRTMTEMIQRQRDAVFTSGEKHCKRILRCCCVTAVG